MHSDQYRRSVPDASHGLGEAPLGVVGVAGLRAVEAVVGGATAGRLLGGWRRPSPADRRRLGP